MLHKTRGIVLHTIKFTETSVITKIYTEAFGLQSYIVNGARSSRSKGNASFFTRLNILNLEIYRREHKNLQRIKECEMGCVFKSLPFDVIKSSIAMFLAEVLNKVIREEEANSALFGFIEKSLITLDESKEDIQNFHLLFLLDLTKYLGFYPSDELSGESLFFDLKEGKFVQHLPEHASFIPPPASGTFHSLLSGDFSNLSNHQERNKLLEKILLYYSLHVENFGKMKSHLVLHEALSDSQ